MEYYSHTSHENIDPYLRKMKQQRIVVAGIGLAITALLVFGIIFTLNTFNNSGNIPKISRSDLINLWSARNYSEVSLECNKALESSPLDPFFLVFKGLSSFYIGISESDSEKRTEMMDTAIFSLRKALVSNEVPLRPEAIFVLGKSYFHKGLDYYGEASEYLQESLEAGYVSHDAWEYLALAAQGSNQLSKSAEYFDKAMSLKPDSPELIIAAAAVNKALGNIVKAENLAKEALLKTSDSYLAEKSNFLLGEILIARGRYSESMAIFDEIIKNNPYSADAWYFQGLISTFSGDLIKARAAWRKAISIDPMHSNARQKLSERL
jgi:tetratricopeptide (TPR) repeat protein